MTRRGIAWLSEAAELPQRCREVWEDDPRRPYGLPAGRRFDVVVVEQRVGVETFAQLDRHGLPTGPVMADWGSEAVGFFVPPRSRARFGRMLSAESANAPKYRYLDDGSLVVVPGPMPLAGDRYVWLYAPTSTPDASPARTAALAAMLVASHQVVQRAEQYGKEYSHYLADEADHADAGPGDAA
ncbi:bifunctional DNA primase/polymerase [Streptomyces sp. 4N509B]|uniref:bifunctional DNA primase/polymerase n=1 Tax=Streptomyces sp. 4N509B TaxID=3457413 RepID=UPI003FD04ED0